MTFFFFIVEHLEIKSEDGTTYKLLPTTADDRRDFINAYNKAVDEINRIKGKFYSFALF